MLGISMVLNGLVFFVIFAIPAIFNLRVNRLELGLREQLLRMEITLAELADNRAAPETGRLRGPSGNGQKNGLANEASRDDVQ